MSFKRWGMNSAQPAFLSHATLIEDAISFATPVAGREHHSSWFQTINHPDANLIAAAPDLLDAIQSLVQMYDVGKLAEMLDTDTNDAFSEVRIKLQIARLAIAKALNK